MEPEDSLLYKGLVLDCIMLHLNPIFLSTIWILILPPTPRSHKILFAWGFPSDPSFNYLMSAITNKCGIKL